MAKGSCAKMWWLVFIHFNFVIEICHLIDQRIWRTCVASRRRLKWAVLGPNVMALWCKIPFPVKGFYLLDCLLFNLRAVQRGNAEAFDFCAFFGLPQLSKTNFSNNNDFRSFLKSLCATFKEFKMHEQIENEYIIGLLQQRCTVHNVHSDNKLSEMLSLLEKGLHNIKVISVDLFTPSPPHLPCVVIWRYVCV